MEYVVIQNGELNHFHRFSNNGDVARYLEEQINDYGYGIEQFLVLRGEHIEGLTINTTKTIRVSVSGC